MRDPARRGRKVADINIIRALCCMCASSSLPIWHFASAAHKCGCARKSASIDLPNPAAVHAGRCGAGYERCAHAGSALFRVASDLRLNEGLDSLRERFNQPVSFSVRDAQRRRADLAALDGGGAQRDADGLPDVQSRMDAFMLYSSGSYVTLSFIS
ncbi:hypothetical protein FIBSPDRAFT_955727 [Athelia psychrophila]|uniref:Uncharacterized protein n=1 Tax=Athelia psychrophila TaxID=1759441 RepID=A0A166HSV1_9AGAM|nr:hypothetical protein FIBSPDRAFT_955727 [Fibularhizoctonia sp. CBS 109695]